MKIVPNRPRYHLYANVISKAGPMLLRMNISEYDRKKYDKNPAYLVMSEYQKYKL